MQEPSGGSAQSEPAETEHLISTLADKNSRRLLMFSGGRDSTLAAVRMRSAGPSLTLVTVSSSHLVGIDRVRMRLKELAAHLAPETQWYHVRQPVELRTDASFYEQTCLPCHHAYVVVSSVIARSLGASHLAFGYAGYQQEWPEQTALAVSQLREVLARHAIELELPVYDIRSKEAAIEHLRSFGLSTDALEQKCLRQVTNTALSEEKLIQQIDFWELAIDRSITRIEEISIETIEQRMLGEFT